MADGAAISGSGALAYELHRVLFADAVVLAGARVAAVGHAARIEHDLVFAAVLLLGPVGGEFVVAVDGDAAHAADETGEFLALQAYRSVDTA